jgi:uncharacterized membrane protein
MTGASEAGRAPAGGQGRVGRLTEALSAVATAAGERVVSAAGDRISGATERLTEYAKNSGKPGLVATATGAREVAKGRSSSGAALKAGLSGIAAKVRQKLGGGAGAGKGKVKVTNIVESIDVGVPVDLAYNQWTRFSDWPTFMKKVENVEQDGDEKLTWRAQIFWSHRSWNSTIVEQVPDRRIVWRSDGDKGSVDGSVSFHELAPELTRVLLVLEYHPKGLFERTGNIWRAQGRRARLELKHFARHVMTQSILHPDEVEGWRGEIRDSQVVKDHETALADERQDKQPSRDAETGRDAESEQPDTAAAQRRRPRRRDEGDDDERNERTARTARPARPRQADSDDRNERAAPPVRRRQADPDRGRERPAARGRAANSGGER